MFKPGRKITSTKTGKQFMVLEPSYKTEINGWNEISEIILGDDGMLTLSNIKRVTKAPHRFFTEADTII